MINPQIKTRARLVGAFILIAYGVLVSAVTESKIIVMLADVISGLAVIGIAVLMYPLFKETNNQVSNWYRILKYTEGISMIIGGLIILNPSLAYIKGIIYDDFHIYVFIISAFMFYFLMYKSELLPRYISIWGALGIFALLVSTLLKVVGIQYTMLDYFLVLIITNEVFLAFWLMIKGFNQDVIPTEIYEEY
jgi:hypothetical protein